MRRVPRAFVGVAWLFLLVACGDVPPTVPPPPTPLGTPASRPPDVLFLLVDTLRADVLSSYGEPLPLTPHMDRLARRGRLDAQVQAPSPWTKPSVASLFTGLLPHQHGVLRGFHADEEGGKRVDRLPDGMPTLAERMRDAGYRTVALQSNPHASASQGFGRGFAEYREIFWASGRGLAYHARPILRGEGGPLFLFVQMLDPHTPYVPRPFPFLDPSEPAPCLVALTDVRGSDGMPPHAPDLAGQARRAYLSEVLEVDAAVGAVLRAASERRSVVVVTSDHGEELGDHGGFEHGHTLHEELLHVPRIVVAPGLGPSLEPRPAALQDLFHEIPRLALGEAGAPGAPLLAEGILYGPERASLREGDRKLVVDPASARPVGEFDLAVDPGELTPQPSDDPERARRLYETLGSAVAPPAPTMEIDPKTAEAMESIGYVARGAKDRGGATPEGAPR